MIPAALSLKAQTLTPYLSAGLFALCASIGVLSGGAWGAIGIVGSLMLAGASFLGKGSFAKPDTRVFSFVVLLLSVALLSCFQAIDIGQSFHILLRLMSILLPLLLLASPDLVDVARQNLKLAPKLMMLAVLMVFVLTALLGVAIYSYGFESEQVTKLNRGFSYAIMMLMPIAGYLVFAPRKENRSVKVTLALFFVIVAALCVTHSRAAQMGGAAAICAFLASRFFPRAARAGMLVLLVLSALWPWLTQIAFINFHEYVSALPRSWVHRVEIWDYLSYRIDESPLFGYGIGNAYKLDWLLPHGAMYLYSAGPASHPHNAMVQLWVDLGAWGVAVGLLMFGALIKAIGRLPRPMQDLGLAAYAYTYCLLMSAYSLWTDSLWSAMALTVFAFAVVHKQFVRETLPDATGG